jgi:hypothetical protein
MNHDNFDEIINGLGINTQLVEKKARAAHMSQMLRLMADAIENDAAALEQNEQERDCQILPEHFARVGDRITFCAPTAERQKLSAMLPGLTLAMSMTAMAIASAEEVLDEEEYAEALQNLGMAGVIDIAGMQVVTDTLYADELTLEQAHIWEKLFFTLQNSEEVGSEGFDQLFSLTERLHALRS